MAYRAPQSEMELTIAEILKDVLKTDKVGVDDNFFDLGGNSLLMVQMHSRLQEILGREIQAVEIFNHPTVAALAAYLGDPESGAAEVPVEDRADQLKSGRNRMRQRLQRRRRS